MAKKPSIIHINGRAYDARSGQPLSPAPSETLPKPGKVVKPATTKPQPKTAPKSAKSPKKAAKSTHRTPAKNVPAHRPAHAATLMRSAVKKPAASKLQKSSSAKSGLARRDLAAVSVKQSVAKLDKTRLVKAKSTPKSGLVSHFSPYNPDPTAVPVAGPAPAPHPEPTPPARPAVQQPQPPKPRAEHHRHKTTSDIFETALKTATSHAEPLHTKKARSSRRKRLAGFSGGALLVVAIIGVIISQNMSDLQLQNASARAGFSASLPTYAPAGYSLSKLNSSSGLISTQFRSNSDDRYYTLTQKQSDWDSQDLKDEFLKANGNKYETVTSDGQTVYLYGHRNATWVVGGVWYIVQSNDSLSDRQLVQLATSL